MPCPSYTNILGSSRFTITNCDSITYQSDTLLAGADSCLYVICDDGFPSMCDTATLVVRVNSCKPIVSITRYCTYPDPYGIYGCWGYAVFTSNLSNSDSSKWRLSNHLYDNTDPDTILYGYGSLVIQYGQDARPFLVNDSIIYVCDYCPVIICLTAYNSCGSNEICDTVTILVEGITEIPLSNISIYPNPASNVLIIDMLKNNDEITSNYIAIEIYNALGQKVKTVPKKGNLKTVTIPVSDLPNGTYFANIVDLKGLRKMLGVFLKE